MRVRWAQEPARVLGSSASSGGDSECRGAAPGAGAPRAPALQR